MSVDEAKRAARDCRAALEAFDSAHERMTGAVLAVVGEPPDPWAVEVTQRAYGPPSVSITDWMDGGGKSCHITASTGIVCDGAPLDWCAEVRAVLTEIDG